METVPACIEQEASTLIIIAIAWSFGCIIIIEIIEKTLFKSKYLQILVQIGKTLEIQFID